MDLKESVDLLTKTIQEHEEKKMFNRLGKWLKKFMHSDVTPEQSLISRRILENQLMALL